MKMRRSRRKGEPTIALINIVFLMLIFFLVAGTLAQPMDSDVRLVNASDLEAPPPADAIVVRADGQLIAKGQSLDDLETYMSSLKAAQLDTVRIVPDQSLPARELVDLGNKLRRLGAKRVVLVTERGLQ